MTDNPRTRAIGALDIGALLALVAGFGGVAAAACGVLAQPAFALGVSGWRRTRALAPLPAVFKHDLPSLLALWAGGALLLALLVAADDVVSRNSPVVMDRRRLEGCGGGGKWGPVSA